MSWLAASAVGALTGVAASMGLGGGFILLLYLSFASELSQSQAQGVNLLFFLPIIAVAVGIHLKNKLIDVKTALICGGLGALSAPLGYLAAGALGDDALRKAFAVFVIIAGLKDLFSQGVDKRQKGE